MTSQSRLHNRHTILEERINAELRRPSPDTTAVQRMKKEKLSIKEKLTES